MTYLSDTHILFWYFTLDKKSPERLKQLLDDKRNRICVSIVSIWELAIKINIGKLQFPSNTQGFSDEITRNGFEYIPITSKDIFCFETLPLYHCDPFDRLLTATAMTRVMPFLSCDENMPLYVNEGLTLLNS